MVLPGSDNHERAGILPPAELTQEFLGAQFFFDYIFTNTRTGEADINRYLDMTEDELEKINIEMHSEAAPYENSIERHTHISHYWSIVGQYFARLASKDGLTGLFNKHAFADMLDKSLKRVADYQGQDRRDEGGSNHIALIDIDLNRFKPINDIFGHATGDIALKETSRLLETSIRLEDMAARIGGDEFSVLLRGATKDEAKQAFKRLEGNFEQLTVEISTSAKINIKAKELNRFQLPREDERCQKEEWKASDLSSDEYRRLGLDVRFTDAGKIFLSIDATLGMAMSEPHMTADELEARADENMYQNKSNVGWEHYSR